MERFGDLGVDHAAVVRERQGLTLLRGQRLHAGTDAGVGEVLLEQLQRLAGRIRRHGERVLVELDRVLVLVAARAQPVDGLVADDVDHPGHRRAGIGPVGLRVVPDAHVSLLEVLLRALFVPQHTQGDGERCALVSR